MMDMSANTSKEGQRKMFFKIGFILILILLLMIPNMLIQGLIFERKGLGSQTQRDIAASWGPSQKMMGPVLSIPYTTEFTTDDGKMTYDHVLRVLPESLEIDVELNTEERKKSIYKAILYTANHNLNGYFNLPDESKFGKNLSKIHWNDAKIDIGFTSSASLDNIVNLKCNKVNYKMESGASDSQLFPSAIHANIEIDPSTNRLSFDAEIGVNGSEAIKYLPLASNTQVTVNSNWDSPGFVGLPLPAKREISENGFVATWKSTEYNRPFKDTWKDAEVQLSTRSESFGVDLVQTVGHYQKNMRSAKYALLIISLSFLVFFFFETLKGSRIHPVQYIFIGLALSIFYSLLLSLSEHIGFDSAYLIAAGAVVGLISWYSKFMLSQGNNVMILTIILGGLYTYIYILLQMEEFALLVGSIGLFMVLAISMYLSRNMDWYGSRKLTTEIEPEAAFV
jgi:inner membrane protein